MSTCVLVNKYGFYSCKPQLAQLILSEQGMTEALEGKLLISIQAGVTIRQLTEWVSPSTRVVRAMPNTPCRVRSFFSLQDNQNEIDMFSSLDSRRHDNCVHPAALDP